jgi:ketosteroid isomerase-like protein
MGEAAEVVRRGFELLAANDLDALVELCDPSIEFHDPPEIPGSKLYRGPEGVKDWVRSAREASEDISFRIAGIEEEGEAVLVDTAVEMHGRASGAEVDWSFWTVWRVRDGLITYQHGYGQREDALADFSSQRE